MGGNILGRWLDAHTPPPSAAPVDISLWITLCAAALVAGGIWHFKEKFKPGFATAVLGFVALIYAAVALFVSKPNLPFAMATILVGFILMIVEIQSIANDSDKRDKRHDEVVGHFQKVIDQVQHVQMGIGETIRLQQMAAEAPKDSLKQHLLSLSADLMSYVNQRQAGRPNSTMNTPMTLGYSLPDPMVMIQLSNQQITYDNQTRDFYADQFPKKIEPLVEQAAKIGKAYTGPYYQSAFDIFTMQSIAYGLQSLAESLDDA